MNAAVVSNTVSLRLRGSAQDAFEVLAVLSELQLQRVGGIFRNTCLESFVERILKAMSCKLSMVSCEFCNGLDNGRLANFVEPIWELLEKALESLEGPFRASGVLKGLASGSNHLEVVSGVHAGFGMGIQKGSALPPTPCFALQRLLKDPCYPMVWSRIHQICKLFFITRCQAEL